MSIGNELISDEPIGRAILPPENEVKCTMFCRSFFIPENSKAGCRPYYRQWFGSTFRCTEVSILQVFPRLSDVRLRTHKQALVATNGSGIKSDWCCFPVVLHPPLQLFWLGWFTDNPCIARWENASLMPTNYCPFHYFFWCRKTTSTGSL